MADWQAIKNEFITTKTSFRKLAEKYGLNKDTIWKKAKDEEWDRQRRQHIDNVQTELLEYDIEQKVSGAKKLNEAAEMLLEIAVTQMKARDPMEMSTQEMKHISGVLRDVKDTLMIKSQKDLEEQDARISKLRRDAEKDEKEKPSVTITLEGGLSDYAQ